MPLLDTFGLAGFERVYPFQLFGGMRQRVALLRTVVQDCEVLLLGEPFGALDALTRMRMQTWLEEVRISYRWTVLLISHDIREAVLLSDRVYVFSSRSGTRTRLRSGTTAPTTPPEYGRGARFRLSGGGAVAEVKYYVRLW